MAARQTRKRKEIGASMHGRWHARSGGVLSLLLLCLGGASADAIGGPRVSVAAPASSSLSSSFGPDDRALLDRYCVTCHNARLQTGGLRLDQLDLADVRPAAATWEKVVRKLRAGAMPPVGRPRPEASSTAAFAGKLEGALDAAAAAHPTPGRPPTFHRLNRTEYQAVIRDLLALDMDVSTLLPPDDASYGFDNIAGVLGVSPTLLERYMAAARRVSQLAVGNIAIPAGTETFRIPGDLPQEDRIEELPVGTRGGLIVRHHFPLDAEYAFTIELARNFLDGTTIPEPHQIELTIDDERVRLFTVGEKRPEGAPRRPPGAPPADAHLQARIPVKAGPHAIGVAFIKKNGAQSDSLRLPFSRPAVERGITDGQPYLGGVSVSGPFDPQGAGDTPSRRRIFSCGLASGRTMSSKNGASVSATENARRCANRILTTVARRAYRRPVTPDDVTPLLALYDQGYAESGFEGGVELALRRLLVSLEFLFRVERDPARIVAGAPYRLTDLHLASRLSFFLWSSIPDDELLATAERGRLHVPAVLEQQVRRMLQDSRSQALVSNFAGQWLYLRNIPSVVPDRRLFPNFDESLRRAFRRETELLFESVLRENRSVVDLLTSDETFLNERLAKHYGMPSVYGSHFRRVSLKGTGPRRGILGHGSMLTVTSYPTRTSPVLRGKWIMENVLGVPPPPPPPNVPDLRDTNRDGHVLSMRERMVQHRSNPACASCHAQMDPLGLSLENFDAVGRFRERGESNEPIDASGALLNGTRFEGADGLRQGLLERPEGFVTTVTEKLLTYALGRGLEAYDAPAVRRIVRDAAASQYALSALVLGIIKSEPFQWRSATASSSANSTSASVSDTVTQGAP